MLLALRKQCAVQIVVTQGRESLVIFSAVPTIRCEGLAIRYGAVSIPNSDVAAQDGGVGDGLSSSLAESRDTAGFSWLWNWC